MSEEYDRGREQGRNESNIGNLMTLLTDHIAKQEKWNDAMNRRASALEAWVQTTTGKVVVLTAVFSIIGSFAYVGINWLMTHIKLR